jgi:hypothetical protein
MAGYIGTRAVLLSTTAADVTGDMTVAGDTTVSGAFTSLGIDDNATSTAITIDASENVGIGTDSPSDFDAAGDNLVVGGGSGNNGVTVYSGTANAGSLFFANGTGTAAAKADGYIQYGHNNQALVIATGGGNERMRIDASGNVGIGAASPDEKLHILGGNILLDNQVSNTSKIIFAHTAASNRRAYMGAVEDDSGNGNSLIFAPNANGTDGAEAMRIDSSGNVLVGTANTLGGVTGTGSQGISLSSLNTVFCSRSGGEALHLNRQATTGNIARFRYNGVEVGNISVTGSATSYNHSSDYRLKENVTAIQGAADIVMAMKPCTYTAIVDGLWYDGFLAHELQEVHPRAVTGTKDAMMDEEYEVTPATETEEAVMGTRSVPDMQSVDYSKLTPILTAALQEALTEIAALKVRVAALEVTP